MQVNGQAAGAVIRGSGSQSVDLGFVSQAESYKETLRNAIHSFPASRLAQKGWCGEQAGKLTCCVFGARHLTSASVFMPLPLCGGAKQSTRQGG